MNIMKSCKNCGIEINEKLTYCSYKCRNIYVNKNLRDYSKNIQSLKNKGINEYILQPKICLNCNSLISYDKRNNKFCSKSCSTSYTNKIRKVTSHILSEIGYENIKNSNQKRYEKVKDNYNNNPHLCIECGNILSFKKRNFKFCKIECKRNFQNKNIDSYTKYKNNCQFTFSLNDYPNEFDFSLIEKYGWYKPKNHGNNLGGISRDHMYSIKSGYKNNIDSKIISHPANCKLMVHNDNVKKFDSCSIQLNELIERINNWNKKYLLS